MYVYHIYQHHGIIYTLLNHAHYKRSAVQTILQDENGGRALKASVSSVNGQPVYLTPLRMMVEKMPGASNAIS